MIIKGIEILSVKIERIEIEPLDVLTVPLGLFVFRCIKLLDGYMTIMTVITVILIIIMNKIKK